jgi:glycosyltransferase involved in cell wall biosynthesis
MPVENRLPLSVAIITLNEEANLSRCPESICDPATEAVAIDFGSTDGICEVALNHYTFYLGRWMIRHVWHPEWHWAKENKNDA